MSRALPLLLALALASGCVPRHPGIEAAPAPAYATASGRNQVRLDVAEALLDDGKPGRARQVLALAVEEGADPHEVALLQGRAMWMEGLSEEAEVLLLKARRGMPKDARPYSLLGLIHADSGRVDEAIADYREVTRLDPQDAAGWNNLGFLLLSQGNYDEARQALSRAVTLDGTNPKYRTNLGFALAGVGRHNEALQAFRGVGSEADAQANLALAFELSGDPQKASVHYRKALDENPVHKAALDGLERLDQGETP